MSRAEIKTGKKEVADGRACLCLLGAGGAVDESWHLTSRPMAFGRGATADAFVDDDSLSRTHFLVTHEGDEFFIIDLDSQNGTFVQGDRITAHKLRHGDVIRAGQSLFCFTNFDGIAPGPIRVPLPATAKPQSVLPLQE